MSEKSIIFIAPGNSIHSYKWISEIYKQTNFKIFWLSFHGSADKIEGIEQFSFSKDFIGILKCIRKIKSIKNSIIHVHSIGFHSYFFFLAKIFGVNNTTISTPWGSDIIFGRNKFFKKFFLKFIIQNSKIITCDAVFVKELVTDLKRDSNINIINFGVDTKKFSFINRNFKKENINILSTRSLEKIYNIKSIIKSASIIKSKGINFKLSIYADGPDRKDLEYLASSLNVSSDVIFHGRYSQDNLVEILNNHDIYISMSHSDAGIASSTAEAMATGMICCVSDVAENNLWIEDFKSGFLIQDDDHIDLANKIEQICEHKFDLNKISKSARAKIERDNSIYGEMKKMVDLYLSAGK